MLHVDASASRRQRPFARQTHLDMYQMQSLSIMGQATTVELKLHSVPKSYHRFK